MGDERSRNFNTNLQEVRRQLPTLQGQWQGHLSRKFPRLRDHHADLCQQVAEQLLIFAEQHPETQVESWVDFSFRMLQRRIVDLFRSTAKRWAESPLEEELLPPADPVGDPERVAHYVLLLKRVVGLIATLNAKDRELLLSGLSNEGFASTPEELQRRLSDAERKRLSRLRSRLREEIEK